MKATSPAPFSRVLRQENSPSHLTPDAFPMLTSYTVHSERPIPVWDMQQHAIMPHQDHTQMKSLCREIQLALYLQDSNTGTSLSLWSLGPQTRALSYLCGKQLPRGPQAMLSQHVP